MVAAVLDKTQITSLNLAGNDGIGVEGVKAIAAVLKDSQLSTLGCAATPNLHLAYTPCRHQKCSAPDDTLTSLARSLSNNALCGIDTYGNGTYAIEGITALCEGLKGSAVTSLT